MKIKKIIRLLLIILIIVLFTNVIKSTYSKYITTFDKQTGVGVLGWNIKVNNQRIIDDATFTNNLKVNFEKNEHIADNVIAPTKRGTVDLILDSTGTEVPYQYEIEIVDGDVDYESSYGTKVNTSWPSGSNETTYEIEVTLDYKHLDYPIWYWPNGSGQLVETMKDLELVLPEGFIRANCINCASVYDRNTRVLTITPIWHEWKQPAGGCPTITLPNGVTTSNYASNILVVKLHLTYQGVINIDTEDFWHSVSIDGKKILKSNLPDYRIYAYEFNDQPKVNVADNSEPIKGIIQPAESLTTTVQNRLKLYVEWYDGSDNIMDNAADVAVTKIDNPYGTVPIGVKVTQVE